MKIPAKEFKTIEDYLPVKVENTHLGARFFLGGTYYVFTKEKKQWVLYEYLDFDFFGYSHSAYLEDPFVQVTDVLKKIKKLGRNLDIALVNLWIYIKNLEL